MAALEKLGREFYEQPARRLARALIGKILVHRVGGKTRRARIVETEAYVGPHDLACHASKGRTARTDVMFALGGHAYVYLIYGMYDCFNVVTDAEDFPSAVLIRGVSPVDGCLGKTDGPGKLCRAMSITRALNRKDLLGDELFIEPGEPVASRKVKKGPRIGVDYARHWARRHLRFSVGADPHVSR